MPEDDGPIEFEDYGDDVDPHEQEAYEEARANYERKVAPFDFVNRLTPWKLPGALVPRPPAPPTPSPMQRLRIHIPHVSTTITAGAAAPAGKVRGGDSGKPNFKGFGVDTAGHVFINARGEKADSRMSFQATGQVLVQSDKDSLYLVSAGPAALASANAVNVAGGSGVNIVAGWGTSISNEECPGDGSPSAPAAIASLPDKAGDIATFWSRTDSLMAAAGVAAGAIQTRLGEPNTGWLGNLLGLGNLSALGCVVNNSFGESDSGPLGGGGVTIHGAAGWVLGTPLYGAAYAAAGLTIASAFTGVMGLVEASVMAAKSASLTAGDSASVTGGRTVDLVAGRDVELAARTKTLKMFGKSVVIGTVKPVAPQVATKEIDIEATQRLRVASDDVAGFTAKTFVGITAKTVVAGGDTLILHGEKTAELRGKDIAAVVSDKKVSLQGDDASLILEKGKVSLGVGPSFPSLDDLNWMAEPEDIFKEIAKMKAAAAKAKNANAGRVVIKKGKVEVQVRGMKISVSGSSVKSGALKWK